MHTQMQIHTLIHQFIKLYVFFIRTTHGWSGPPKGSKLKRKMGRFHSKGILQWKDVQEWEQLVHNPKCTKAFVDTAAICSSSKTQESKRTPPHTKLCTQSIWISATPYRTNNGKTLLLEGPTTPSTLSCFTWVETLFSFEIVPQVFPVSELIRIGKKKKCKLSQPKKNSLSPKAYKNLFFFTLTISYCWKLKKEKRCLSWINYREPVWWSY